jgi:hypothetical protein
MAAPKNHGKPWTATQTKQLEQLARRTNVPTKGIARRLDRTVDGVRSQAQRRGIRLRPVNR